MVRVFLPVQPGDPINAHCLEDQGRYTLLFPARTRAHRVESLRYRSDRDDGVDETPMDVRGTPIETSGGKRFHKLRPESGKPLTPSLGWSWSSNDTAARQDTTRRIMALAAGAGAPVDGPPLAGGALRTLGGKVPTRSVRDGDGIWCRCTDGSVPVGRRDVQSALAAGEKYTARVCQSRRYLHDHMDKAVRQAFAAAFRERGIHSPEVDGLTKRGAVGRAREALR